jgi:hypothetical protein
LRADDRESAIIAASVNGKGKIREAVRRIKEGDYGLSITISGLIDEVMPMCSELGITPHTVNLSLGVHGRIDLLPPEDRLELTTMCGHALIATHLAEALKSDVEAGRITASEAARTLAQPCVCGIFNLERAATLLAGGAEKENHAA